MQLEKSNQMTSLASAQANTDEANRGQFEARLRMTSHLKLFMDIPCEVSFASAVKWMVIFLEETKALQTAQLAVDAINEEPWTKKKV